MSKASEYFKSIPNLWSWRELCESLCEKSFGLDALEPESKRAGASVARIVTDSRLIESGDLFVALSGDPGTRFNPSTRSTVDGHSFVEQAIEQGAVGAMVGLGYARPPGVQEEQLIRVSDTYDGLWALGRLARSRYTGTVVAVTGSSGKTTAKTFLKYALKAYAPPGSFNNHIGVPLALANLDPSADFCVFEIGTNHPGEIEPLAQMVRPDWAILLNVHQAHIENFQNWEALRQEKLSIFNALGDKSHAIHEDRLGLSFGASFGFEDTADLRIGHIAGDTAEAVLDGEPIQMHIPGGGEHRALTAAAVVLLTKRCGADVSRATALPDSLVPAGRGQVRTYGGWQVIDDSYNANPDSMAQALSAALNRAAQRKSGPKSGLGEAVKANSARDSDRSEPDIAIQSVALVGEMLELGEHGPQAHADLAPLLQQFDKVFCVGEGWLRVAQNLGLAWFAQAEEELLEQVVELCTRNPDAGGVIVVKGSNRVFWAQQFVPSLCSKLTSALPPEAL